MKTPFAIGVLTIALLATAAASPRAAAQFGAGGRPRNTQTHTRNIVLEGAIISDHTIAIVASAITQNLRSAAGDQAPPVVSVYLTPALAMMAGQFGGQAAPASAAYEPTVDSELAIRALNIQVGLPEEGGEIDEAQMNQLWEEARRQLEGGLRKLQSTAYDRGLKQRDRGLQDSRERVDAYRLQYDEAVARFAAATDDLAGGSQQDIESQLSATLAELRQLRVKMVGLQARRMAIDERIDELRAAAEKSAADDPVIEELQKIVDIRKEQVKMMRTRHEAGTGTATGMDVQAAEAELAEARIQFLKAQREAAQLAEGEVLRELNNELSTLIVQAAELEATMKATEEIAEDLRHKAGADRWSQIDLLRGHVERAKRRLIDAEQALFTQETVTVAPLQEISIRPLDDVLAPDAEPATP